MQTPSNPSPVTTPQENPYLSRPANLPSRPAETEAPSSAEPQHGSSAKRSRNTRKQKQRAAALAKPGERRNRKARKSGSDNAGPTGYKAAPKRTRDILGYEAILPSGVAWLGEDEWSMTLGISDINYVAAAEDQQTSIVDRWARFLNSYGAGTRVQETIVNRVLDDADVSQLVQKPLRGDEFDFFRTDFNRIVRDKLAAASGNTVTEKYLTVTVQETDLEKAETTLTRIFHEAEAALQGMDGCQVHRLNRAERLEVFSHILRPHELFTFNEDEFEPNRKLSTADFIAPWEIDAKDKNGPLIFRNGSGDTYHTVLWMRDYPVWLSDRLISELTEIKCDLTISLHLEPLEQVEGMSLVQRQIAELEMQKITEQKRATKQGIDPEMIPAAVKDNLKEAQDLRDELRSSNQKLFSTVMVIGVSATSREKMEQNVKRVMTVIRKQSCTAEVATYMQLDGLTTELPIGRRRIPMRRTLTTAGAAIIVPFTTQELFVPGGNWYGVNAQSSNALVADRTRTTNGNGFILGTSGSGKSQSGKMEITNVLLSRPDDDVIVIDPEHEYEPLIEAFGGEVIRIHAGSEQRVNPMDIELNFTTGEDDPINAKCEFVLTMLEALVGGKAGLTPEQRSVADRSTLTLYRKHAAEGGPMPTLVELREALAQSGEDAGRELARMLEIYTIGSLGGFSNRTNVNPANRLVSWDISKLGNELRTFGMMVILDQIWNRVARNRAEGRRTWLYIDEFHLLFSNKYSADYFRGLYKRARKWGLIPTGITQNIEELLANQDARLMLANCDFLLLLGQNATDADSLCELLHFSEEQRRFFTNVQPGHGLMRSGNAVIPMDGRIPTDSALYKLFSTSFGER